MNSRLFLLLLLLVVLISSTACHRRARRAAKAPIVAAQIVDTVDINPSSRPSLKLDDVARKYPSLNRPWETFSAKFKANYQDSGRSLSFSINCRSRRAEATHLFVQGPLGISIAEVLVRPDSFFLDNKFEHTFSRGASSAGAAFSGLPLDFNLLQTLLTGIPTLDESAFNRIDSSGGLFRFQMRPDKREMTYAGEGPFPATIFLYGHDQTGAISFSDPKMADGLADVVPSKKKLALGNPQGRELLSLTLLSQTAKFNQPVELPRRLTPRNGDKIVEVR